MSNTIGNNSRPAIVVRPTVPAKAPISRPSADSLERSVTGVSKAVSAPISKPKAPPTSAVVPTVSADHLQQKLSQSRPSDAMAGPRPSSTWGAAAAAAGSSAVTSISQAKADPKNNPDDVLLDYAKKSGEDLSDGLTDQVLDKVRDGLVDRAESCVGTSGTEDLKKFDRAQLASDLAKSTLDVAQAQKDLKQATTPVQRAKALVDLAEAQRDAALAVGEFAENSAERQRIEEECRVQDQSNPIYGPITDLNNLPNVNTPGQERPGQQRPTDTQGGIFSPTPIVVTSPGILVTTSPFEFELGV